MKEAPAQEMILMYSNGIQQPMNRKIVRETSLLSFIGKKYVNGVCCNLTLICLLVHSQGRDVLQIIFKPQYLLLYDKSSHQFPRMFFSV